MPTIVKPSSETANPPEAANRDRRGSPGLALAAAALVCVTLGSCGKVANGPDEMGWARAALDRNDRLSVVATDPQARTFTVKLKDSGELRVIPIDQIVAGPPSMAAPDSAKATSVTQPSAESAVTGAPPTAPASPGSDALASAGEQAQSMRGDSAATPEAPAEEVRGPHADSAVNAQPGRVLASGPGYTIKASGPKGPPSRPSPVTAARGTPVERLHDPIICQGSRLLHIDNRNLQFDGDAVSAEDGCEIHITNTHISAKGIGVLARAANVYLENSEIEGDAGAIDASDGAQVYAGSSRFKGLTRRMAAADFHDLGGNVWN